jgi:hypothetical protein
LRSKREEGTGKWRKLHNEKFHNLFFSPNNIEVIKSLEVAMDRSFSLHRKNEKFLQSFNWKIFKKENQVESMPHTIFLLDLPYTNKPIGHEQGSVVLLDTLYISEILVTLPAI